jgi:hypothetical protein
MSLRVPKQLCNLSGPFQFLGVAFFSLLVRKVWLYILVSFLSLPPSTWDNNVRKDLFWLTVSEVTVHDWLDLSFMGLWWWRTSW